MLPNRLEETSIDLEGHRLDIIDIGQGDTEHSTIVHVPSIAAVVGGDVVYNQVHMMMGETDAGSREQWIRSLDQIAALKPQIVVSGHPRVGAPSVPKTIGESQRYLRDFSRIVASEETVEGIVKAMLALHPDRDNPRVVWHSAREEIKEARLTHHATDRPEPPDETAVTVERRGHVLLMGLNRPEKRNAFNVALIDQLRRGVLRALSTTTTSDAGCCSGAGVTSPAGSTSPRSDRWSVRDVSTSSSLLPADATHGARTTSGPRRWLWPSKAG